MTEDLVVDISDGRLAKRVGNRRRMIQAGLYFAQKGQFRFSANDVAKRAGMCRRSFFEIFETMDGFVDELLSEHEATIQATITAQVREEGKSIARLVLLGH